MRTLPLFSLVKETATSWSEDHAQSMGAALAYYTLFSIAPLLLIVISVTGLVFGADTARSEIVRQLDLLIGREGAQAIASLIESVSQPSRGGMGALIGVITLGIGATTVFAELQDSLDRIWEAPTREGGGIWNLLRTRLLSFGLVLGIGFLLMVSLVLSAAMASLGRWWAPLFGAWEVLAQAANVALSFALTTAMFAMIYKWMPRVQVGWRDVMLGAVVTSLLFTLGKLLIGLYIGKSGVASGFGAASSVVALLVWVYYSAQIFLIGAEFTWVYARRHGSRRQRPTDDAERTPLGTGSLARAR